MPSLLSTNAIARPACARAALRGARGAAASARAPAQKSARLAVVMSATEGSTEMPLWQKVQRQSRDVPVEVLPDMSQVDNVETLDIEASQAPLWSSAHMKTEKTMWQTVNTSRDSTAAEPAAAIVAEESTVAVSDIAKGAAPLWAQVHEKKPVNMWQKVNVTRDQSLVDLLPGMPPPPEPEPVEVKPLDIAPSQPPAWQRVHLNVQGEPQPEPVAAAVPEKKKGFFARLFSFLG